MQLAGELSCTRAIASAGPGSTLAITQPVAITQPSVDVGANCDRQSRHRAYAAAKQLRQAEASEGGVDPLPSRFPEGETARAVRVYQSVAHGAFHPVLSQLHQPPTPRQDG